jgi:beta-lactamase class C
MTDTKDSAMRRWTRTLAMLLVPLALAMPQSLAQPVSVAAPPVPGPDPVVLAAVRELDPEAQRLFDASHLPGMALAVVHRGQPLLLRGYGVTDAAGNEPVTLDTVFRTASLSKAFAASLCAQLVAEGAMQWNAPIADQLPGFRLRDPTAATRVTARDILSHRVGLPYNTLDRSLEADEPYPLLVMRLSESELTCPPGDCYGYQNIAFSLIGDLVFARTGRFYEQEVERRLFVPLGMRTATYGRDALEASASWARPHVRRGRNWIAVRPKETYYRVPPAAGVNASIRDMSLWLAAQMGHAPEVLPPSLLSEIQTPQVATPGEIRRGWRETRLWHAYYGLGWRIFDYRGHTLLYHAGAVQGYRATIAFLPERDVGLVLLWNSEGNEPAALVPGLFDRVLGLAPAPADAADAGEPAEDAPHD